MKIGDLLKHGKKIYIVQKILNSGAVKCDSLIMRLKKTKSVYLEKRKLQIIGRS